jgi:Zn-dependent M28 family amino/carboxypeptidase
MAQPSARKSRGRRTVWGLGALAGAALLACGAFSLTSDPNLGKAALEHARKVVAFGPRPAGSAANQQAQRYIAETLRTAGFVVEQDRFSANTPNGTLSMNNIIGRRDGRSGRVFVLATHYDTKWETAFRFVGANDGGSGTGLLLALASVVAKQGYNHSLWLVFLDGEEAIGDWSDTDSLYGSRHLAAQWKSAGITPRIGAFLLLDMIGDASLDLNKDSNSTPWLRDRVWTVAKRLGYSRSFLETTAAYEDDHIPFIRSGVAAVDLLDLNYGPSNRYWHTAEDTLDKLSPQSLQIVGDVVLGVLDDLDRER